VLRFGVQLLYGPLPVGRVDLWAFPQLPDPLGLFHFLLHLLLRNQSRLLDLLQFLHGLLELGLFLFLPVAFSAGQVDSDIVIFGVLGDAFVESGGLMDLGVELHLFEIGKEKLQLLLLGLHLRERPAIYGGSLFFGETRRHVVA
jgi:hypothetical protein